MGNPYFWIVYIVGTLITLIVLIIPGNFGPFIFTWRRFDIVYTTSVWHRYLTSVWHRYATSVWHWYRTSNWHQNSTSSFVSLTMSYRYQTNVETDVVLMSNRRQCAHWGCNAKVHKMLSALEIKVKRFCVIKKWFSH